MQLYFHAAHKPAAQDALAELTALYGQSSPEQADIIVPLGGDGTMLETLHRFHALGKPVYGMNRGSTGFLLNPYRSADLPARLAAAQAVNLHPLRMTAHTLDGETVEALAFNDVALVRQTRHAAKIKIAVDGHAVMEDPLVGDGIIVCTPAGSSAYNFSSGGPIIPIGGNVLALTPVSPYRPRRWRGALLPAEAAISFEVVAADYRCVRAETDAAEVPNLVRAEVRQSRKTHVTLLFDPDHNLEARILKEQFLP